jgi:acetolactate synthase-1/2/3 large subunit
MSLGDLETARRMGLSFAIVVFNNAASGYVKALQHLMYGEGAYQSSDLAETNYARVAEAMGCVGIRVEDPKDLAGAFKQGLAAKGVPDRHRRGGDARPGAHAAGRRQPHGSGQKGDRVA